MSPLSALPRLMRQSAARGRAERLKLADAAVVTRRRHNSYEVENPPSSQRGALPGIRRIILVRHGESLGNVDECAYGDTADWRIPLTERGRDQARSAGREVASHLGRGGGRGRVLFYVSPYLRTRQTLREMLREVDSECAVAIREDPRIAEQQFGNFQSHGEIQDNKEERSEFGRFFYRFPDGGESGFDVYNRVSGFIGTMQRDAGHALESVEDGGGQNPQGGEAVTMCLVTHGLALRLFLMRWFQYTVHEFERSHNPSNGRVVALEPSPDGEKFELTEADRLAMGFPLYRDQERWRVLDDHGLLDNNDW